MNSPSTPEKSATSQAIEIAIRLGLIFLIWSIVVSSSDMVLKPMLLGRGVNVPMLVILLGAIGGMITSGIVGLFIGAVILNITVLAVTTHPVPDAWSAAFSETTALSATT